LLGAWKRHRVGPTLHVLTWMAGLVRTQPAMTGSCVLKAKPRIAGCLGGHALSRG
jgi:hypothetical protein